jgi:hypothetical protein
MCDAATPVAYEDAAAEAEAAISTVDSEFGRTTDPVRMYMREMGVVNLLTRNDEIEIAKRIEDGLKHMIQAISACPATIAEILALAEKVEEAFGADARAFYTLLSLREGTLKLKHAEAGPLYDRYMETISKIVAAVDAMEK